MLTNHSSVPTVPRLLGVPIPTPSEVRSWATCFVGHATGPRWADLVDVADRVEATQVSLHEGVDATASGVAAELRAAALRQRTELAVRALRSAIAIYCQHHCLEARDDALLGFDRDAERRLDHARDLVRLLDELRPAQHPRVAEATPGLSLVEISHDLLELAFDLRPARLVAV